MTSIDHVACDLAFHF
jgi:hypothetical protein